MTETATEGWTIDRIQAVLESAMRMRAPIFTRDMAPRMKVSEIEDYMVMAACGRGELEEVLFELDLLVDHFKERIESMTGWEVGLNKPAGRATNDDVLRAKRTLDPEPFEAGTRARQLRDAVKRQIARFEWECLVLSRVYTVISGG